MTKQLLKLLKIQHYFPLKIYHRLENNVLMKSMKNLRYSSSKITMIGIKKYLPLQRVFGVVLPFSFVLHSLSKQEENIANDLKVIQAADELYDAAQYEDLFTLLYAERESDNEEILWRLARALFEKCRSFSDKDKLIMLEEAFGYIKKALDINDNCSPAHKWCAILTDYVWRYKSTKGRIIHSFEMKKHMEKAVELNPKDSTSYYLLGEWCYTFADMPWYQRKVASVIFASPPSSTYEEALNYFQEAEKISPNFYSMNLLMMGKCFLKIDEIEKAIQYLIRARDYPIKTPDDEKAHEEALYLLKGFGVN